MVGAFEKKKYGAVPQGGNRRLSAFFGRIRALMRLKSPNAALVHTPYTGAPLRLLSGGLAPIIRHSVGRDGGCVVGEAIMSNVVLRRIAPPVSGSESEQFHPTIVEACLTAINGERTSETAWEAPTRDEWRRAALIIAKQVALHIAGYRDHEEFARDGCRFAWDVYEILQVTGRRGH